MAQKTFALSVTSHRAAVQSEVDRAIARALETCGGKAETYAKKGCPVDTGYLRNSITHGQAGGKTSIETFSSDSAGKTGRKPIRTGSYAGTIPSTDTPTEIIATNVEYAPYQEFGRHTTSGKYIGGKAFMEKAMSEHISEYKAVFENELKKI